MNTVHAIIKAAYIDSTDRPVAMAIAADAAHDAGDRAMEAGLRECSELKRFPKVFKQGAEWHVQWGMVQDSMVCWDEHTLSIQRHPEMCNPNFRWAIVHAEELVTAYIMKLIRNLGNVILNKEPEKV